MSKNSKYYRQKEIKKFVTNTRKKHRYQVRQKDYQKSLNIAHYAYSKKHLEINKLNKHLADMHIHLDVPDSYNSLEYVVSEAKLFDTYILGITDHDYTGTRLGVGKFLEENFIPYNQIIVPYDNETTLIPGVEVNTRCNGLKFHLLVFGANRDPRLPFNKFIRIEYQRKYMRFNFYYALLKEFGSTITFEQYTKINKIAHIENEFLTELNGVILLEYIDKMTDISENEKKLAHKIISFAKVGNPYVMHNMDKFREVHLQSEDLIKLAHDAGGIVIWAHPPYTTSRPGDYGRAYNKLLDVGLDGIESYKELYKFDKIFWTVDDKKHKNLILSAGSDRHIPNRRYGHVRGINSLPIYENELPILQKLYKMDAAEKPEVKIRSINEALKEFGNTNPEQYERKLNLAKYKFICQLFLIKQDLYEKKFGIDGLTLFKIAANPENEKFMTNYFDYLCSEDVGKEGMSPIYKLVEAYNNKIINKDNTKIQDDSCLQKMDKYTNLDPNLIIPKDYVDSTIGSYNEIEW